MTIRRRTSPTDFGASSELEVQGAAPALAPETDFNPTDVNPADINQPLVAPLVEAEPGAPLQPPAGRSEVAASPSRTPARTDAPAAASAKDYATPSGWPIWLVALVVSVLWALAPIAYAVGYRRGLAPLTEDIFAVGVFALLAIGPAIFVWGCAYMIRQGQKLAAETRRAKAMAEEMLVPALAAAARSGHVVQAIRDEIVSAGRAADEARETLLALRQALAAEAASLVQTTQSSVRTAKDLAGALGRERSEMEGLSQALDVQAAKVADTIAQQTQMVADATAIAETNLREARVQLSETLGGQVAQISETLGDKVAQMSETVGGQVALISETVGDKVAQIAETLGQQAQLLTEAAGAAEVQLRDAEAQLSGTLDGQAARITETIGNQARMVADAAEVAESQLKEAEAVLAARAADLVAAAGEAGDAARTAGEDLVRHIARLESAGVGVTEQVRGVEGGLAEQRTALITLSGALKTDHETFSAEAQAHAERLSDFISQARLSAVEMADRAAKGADALRSLVADAALQFRDLAETARAEREEFGQSTLQSLDAVSQAAADQRALLEGQTRAAIEALHAAAEETREAAARHASSARDQVDQLSEAAFSAGQKANEVFEKRLEEARALVEQSSKMVEEAGAATARRLDEGAAAARATLGELEAMLGELEARAARMPQTARGQVEEVRGAVTHGMEELMAAARRTAEEAQAIDAAFQDRVRRNFEMLSEAVRLMGTVAAAPAPAALAPASMAPAALAPPPLAPAAAAAPPAASPLPTGRALPMASFAAAYVPRPRSAAPPPEPEPEAAAAAEPEADEPDLELDDLVEPAPRKSRGKAEKAASATTPLAERLGLRPRLKLTPTATDEEFSQVFEAASGRAAEPAKAAAKADAEGWGWKDLLASIDGGDAEGESLQDTLTAELSAMGVDPEKLLPKARVDEVAAAVQTGDLEGARKVVRRLAPAATRRITRRLGTDEVLRRQVTAFVSRHQALVDDAVVKDPEGFLMAELLASPPGRLFLLLDAASGDMV